MLLLAILLIYIPKPSSEEELKSFSKVPGCYRWVLVIFIYLFVYSFMFCVKKFYLTTVNKIFS